jgi:hypothetical protein
MTDAERQFAGDEQEINLNDIIDFFVTKWKVLLGGALAGFVMALGGAFWLGQYEAEATLVNKSVAERQGIERQGIERQGIERQGIERQGIERQGIDYLTWKSLQRNLPILAARASEANAGEEGFLKVLSSKTWWQSNVVPTFALAKEDAKIMPGISKELQNAESVKIKDFVVTAKGASKEEVLENLSVATAFLRSGAAYLALEDVIAGYRIELLNAESGTANEIAASEIELAYLKGRLAELESLRARFPGNAAAIIAQPADYSDSGAKYLPVVTQLVAVHTDIGALKEKLSRLNSRKSQLAIMGGFLSQAVPVLDGNLDGLAATAELMRIEAGMRKDLPASDWNRITVLNGIRQDLVSIQTRFTLGLEQPTFFDTRRPGYPRFAAIGLAAGFFLALLSALGAVAWSRYRMQKLRG